MAILSILLIVFGIVCLLAGAGIIAAVITLYRVPTKQPYRCKWKNGVKIR